MRAFPRTALAEELVGALQGKSAFSDAPNGLFLTAPRRTGKTTFLREDLTPALVQAGVLVAYVDLWADTARDPGILIAEAVGRAAEEHLGLVARTAKRVGLEKVNLGGWLEVDTRKIGKVDGLTLADALQALREDAERPVALIIDEAQHALTSEAGERAMSALKSARDQINRPGGVHLMLVMSGSDRDKLLRLVNSSGAPFYGSQVHPLPPLGADFIDDVARQIETRRPELRPVERATLQEAFRAFGCRPQFFFGTIGQVLSPFSDLEGRFEGALLQAAQQHQRDEESQMESEYLGLRPIEQALLWRMLELGPKFRPYDADALAFYAGITGGAVSPAKAQRALEALRQRTPALVWRSARGEYALQDAAMHRWFEQRRRGGGWPPKSVKRETL